jgi:hypothetical protein
MSAKSLCLFCYQIRRRKDWLGSFAGYLRLHRTGSVYDYEDDLSHGRIIKIEKKQTIERRRKYPKLVGKVRRNAARALSRMITP